MNDEIIGKKFGRRIAIHYTKTTRSGRWYMFKCECGQEKELLFSNVKYGRNQQCRECQIANAKRDRLKRKLHWLEQVDERGIQPFLDIWFANDYDSKA